MLEPRTVSSDIGTTFVLHSDGFGTFALAETYLSTFLQLYIPTDVYFQSSVFPLFLTLILVSPFVLRDM